VGDFFGGLFFSSSFFAGAVIKVKQAIIKLRTFTNRERI
jgi:hypothetical protein